MSLHESTESAGSTPNEVVEFEPLEQLTSVARLLDPTADWVRGQTDEGTAYFHIGSAKRLFDYLIEPSSEGGWVGHARGLLGLIPDFRGPTAGLIATMAAYSLGYRLVELGIDAGHALFGD